MCHAADGLPTRRCVMVNSRPGPAGGPTPTPPGIPHAAASPASAALVIVRPT